MLIPPLRWYRLLMIGVFTLVGVIGLWLPAQLEVTLASPSSTITVNSPDDVLADDGVCTLREAITAANTDTPSGASTGECVAGNGADTIVFSDTNTPFTVTLAITGTREDGNSTGDLDILSDVTIQGNPAFTTTIDANQIDRVLDVLSGTVVIEYIALYNGHAPNAAQECNGNSLYAESGGGVRSQGLLTIRASQILSNTTGQGDTILCKPAAWAGGDGGGIWSDGTLVVTDTTIIHNRTGNGGGNSGTCGTGGLPGSPGGSGAGIYAIGTASIEQSLISQNKAGAGGIAIDISDGPSTGGQGGGVYSSGSLILSDTTISYNESGKGGNGAVPFGGPGNGCDGDNGGNGGGVYTTGEITVTNSTIIHNLTREGGEGGEGGPLPYEPGVSGMPGAGGGMFVDDQALILTSRLGQNISAGDGGGIMNMGTLQAEQTTFDENSASNGGGIHNNGVFTSIRNTINGNSAYSFGGIYTVGTLTLESSTVSGNTSQNNSGGIGIFDGTTILRNSTVTHNRGLPSGGIGGSIDATVRLENTIVADNFLGETDSPFDCSNLEIVSLGYLFMRAVEQCEYHANIGDILNQSAHLLPLADNGGNTFTHAFAEGSLAIDRGHCSTTTNDQRGELRPIDLPDFPNGSGNDCDMGALESQPPKTYPTRTATPTFTPSSTPIPTETSTSTPTPTPTITTTPSNTPTATQIPLPTYTPYPTYTPFPTWTPPPGLRELYLPLIER